MMQLQEGQTGTAKDGTRVIVRNGQVVPLNNPLQAPQGMRIKPNTQDFQTLKQESENANTARRMQVELDNFNTLNQKNQTGFQYRVPLLNSVLEATNPDIQVMHSITNRLTPNQRPAGSGATSDFEQRLYARGLPNIETSPQANKNIYDARKKDIEGQIARAEFFQAYAQANRGSTVGADNKWSEFANTNPKNFNDWQSYYGLKPKQSILTPARAPKKPPTIYQAPQNYPQPMLKTLQGRKWDGNAPAGSQNNPKLVTNQQQYNSIPKGGWYIDHLGNYEQKTED